MEHQSNTPDYKAGMRENRQPIQGVPVNQMDHSAAKKTSTPYIPLSELTGQKKTNEPSNANSTVAHTTFSAGTTGQNEIKEPINAQLVGLGGWLIWFQIRLYIGGLRLFSDLGDGFDPLILIHIGIIITCLVLFYRHNINFRVVYIVLIGYGIFISLKYLPEILPTLIVIIIIEGLFIYALCKSERVKNTFF